MYHRAALATLVCESPVGAAHHLGEGGVPMRARWRDPRVAPVYAAVVAFAVGGVFGLVSGHSSTTPPGRLVARGGDPPPAELAGGQIEVRGPGGAPGGSGPLAQ